ncbi:MAG: hypothetical protein M1820_005619 [Bogoriella megaspora]|nr:MAG: hypothetical protein M1820_005619 [Bogoriella megaspora]
MVVLKFSLTAQAAAQMHDVLSCLGMFSDSVYIEGRQDRVSIRLSASKCAFLTVAAKQLVLSALNSSRSGYASFTFNGNLFFSHYEFASARNAVDGRFTCQMYNKALSSVFKARLADPRAGDTAIERCDVAVQDQPDKVQCRLIVTLHCRHGVVKTYKLSYEATEVMQAMFNKNAAHNTFQISAKMLKEYTEFFAPKAEQLDFYAENGRVTLASFTDRIVDNKEILKHPVHTSVAIDMKDFEQYNAEEQVHIIISVKDFRAIVSHAEKLGVVLKAQYSQPNRPLQFRYGNSSIICEFTLMTSGSSKNNAASLSAEKSGSIAKTSSVTPSRMSNRVNARRDTSNASSPSRLPPQQRSLGTASRAASVHSHTHSDSLFLPADDDDYRWKPLEDQEPEGDILGWDASGDLDAQVQPHLRAPKSMAQVPDIETGETSEPPLEIQSTQKLSQIRGIFD